MEEKTIDIKNNNIYYQVDENLNPVRIRQKQIGNTVYTIVSKQKGTATQTADEITKDLLRNSVPSFMEQLKTDNKRNSLTGCNSGGKK
ncbi:MAG: hypothetical protein E7346_05495 [Clostridiales bacterium]|nr:hypothetical protein [Clostridiales bacterium]